MSDYLTHLLDRSFAPAPDVRPRIPSIFEAPPATALSDTPLDLDPGNEVVATVFTPNPVVTPPAATARAEPPPPAVPKITLPRPQNSAPQEPIMAGATDGPARTESAGAASIIPQAMPEDVSPSSFNSNSSRSFARNSRPATLLIKPLPPQAHPDPSDNPAVPRVIAQPDTVPRMVGQPDSPAPGHARKYAGAQQSSEGRDSRQLLSRVLPGEIKALNPRVDLPNLAGRTAIHPSLIVEPKEKEVRRASLPGYLVPVARIDPARERAVPAPTIGAQKRPTLPPPQLNPVPVPEIHVSIGRVEVRATPPPTPARAKPKKEPEMSLETYLQRRAEGGRR